jgi:DNA-binding Lrp family transcriptional regulator
MKKGAKEQISAPKVERILLSYGRPYMTQQALAEHFGISLPTVRNRLSEIEELVGNGKRYNETSIIRDGKLVLANVLVFVDYEVFRQRLLNPRMAKLVPPYDPVQTRRDLGYNMFDEELQPKIFRMA